MTFVHSLLRAVTLDDSVDPVLQVEVGQPVGLATDDPSISTSPHVVTTEDIETVLDTLLAPDARAQLERLGAGDYQVAFPLEDSSAAFTLTAVRVASSWCLELRPDRHPTPAAVVSTELAAIGPDQQADPMRERWYHRAVQAFRARSRSGPAVRSHDAMRGLATIDSEHGGLGVGEPDLATWCDPLPKSEDPDRIALGSDELTGLEFGDSPSTIRASQASRVAENFSPPEAINGDVAFPLSWGRLSKPAEDDFGMPTADELWPGESTAFPSNIPASSPNDRPGRITPDYRLTEHLADQGLARLLRAAVKEQATTLLLTPSAPPAIYADAGIRLLSDEPQLSADAIESMLLASMPGEWRRAFRAARRWEWCIDVADVGLVECTATYDRRGALGRFRLVGLRPQSVDQLGLSAEVQALALTPGGLVLVGDRRVSGRRALVAALVDLMSRIRRDYIVTLERHIYPIYTRGEAIVSQRHVMHGRAELLAAARTALREDPDVVVIDDLRGDVLTRLAVRSAAAGHFVIGAVAARTATEGIRRVLGAYPAARRRKAARMLANALRGVVTQVGVRGRNNDRLFAREVLLNTVPVTAAIAVRQLSRLPEAMRVGGQSGMVSLEDALCDFVRRGTVDVAEACRHVDDRGAFTALLESRGIDVFSRE